MDKKKKVATNYRLFNSHLGTLLELDRSFKDLNYYDIDGIDTLKICE